MPILKQLRSHKLVLDTHVLLWLLEGNSALKPAFIKAIDRCQERDSIFISPISIWEIGMLAEKGRIEFDRDVQDWIDEALSIPGFNLVPISPKIAIQSCRLPNGIHGDPADRIIISTAHELNAVLVTSDKQILKFGKSQFITVFDPK